MKRFIPEILVVIATASIMGCTMLRQEAVTETKIGATNITKRTLSVIRTTGDAKQIVDRLSSANTERAHILGARGVDQESNTTNVANIVESVTAGAVRGAVSAVK